MADVHIPWNSERAERVWAAVEHSRATRKHRKGMLVAACAGASLLLFRLVTSGQSATDGMGARASEGVYLASGAMADAALYDGGMRTD